MDNVAEIHTKLTALLANLSPQARRQLSKKIGLRLAQSQRKRIGQNQNPDNTAFEPRKPQKNFGKKKGRLKRQAMFNKLKTARFLKVRSNAEQISVGFWDSNAAIARIHQYGLTGKVQKGKDYKVQYAQRELLGFTDQDLEMIEELVIEQLK